MALHCDAGKLSFLAAGIVDAAECISMEFFVPDFDTELSERASSSGERPFGAADLNLAESVDLISDKASNEVTPLPARM